MPGAGGTNDFLADAGIMRFVGELGCESSRTSRQRCCSPHIDKKVPGPVGKKRFTSFLLKEKLLLHSSLEL